MNHTNNATVLFPPDSLPPLSYDIQLYMYEAYIGQRFVQCMWEIIPRSHLGKMLPGLIFGLQEREKLLQSKVVSPQSENMTHSPDHLDAMISYYMMERTRFLGKLFYLFPILTMFRTAWSFRARTYRSNRVLVPNQKDIGANHQ